MMQAARSSETSVTIRQIDLNLHLSKLLRCEILRVHNAAVEKCRFI
jgi:hypothetical protein